MTQTVLFRKLNWVLMLDSSEQLLAEKNVPQTLRQLFGGYRFWCLLIYSIFILLITGNIASHKHLWWDEICAFYVATLPNVGAMWHALSSGIDWQTPTYYLPLHYLCVWLGPSPFVMRLIAIFPYWLATLVLYFTVARRTAPFYGFIAMLLPSITGAFSYAFEARPYALVLLFTACTLLCRQLAREQRFRRLALPALSISLAAAVCIHYNACLIAVPLLIGEGAAWFYRRKLDFPVILAICCAAIPVMALLPHILMIAHFTKAYSASPGVGTLADIYSELFPRFTVLAAAAICVALAVWFSFERAKKRPATDGTRRRAADEEYALTIITTATFLLLPVVYFCLSFLTHTLYVRYVIETVIGGAMFVAFVLYDTRRTIPHLAGALLTLTILGTLTYAVKRVRTPDDNVWGSFAIYSELFDRNSKSLFGSNDPLLLGGGSYLLSVHYGDENLRRRSVYVVSDPDESPIAFSLADRIFYKALEQLLPGQVHLLTYAAIKRQYRHFQMYDPDPWLFNRLVRDGEAIRIRARLEHGPLYSVDIR